MKYLLVILLICLLCGCDNGGAPGPVGKIKDEALSAGRMANTFAFADEDYFHDMDQTKDGPLTLTTNQIKGRNMWMIWTGGDDRLWDVLNWKSFGVFDLLKTISSHKSLKFGRHNRWDYLGLVNEPCFTEPTEGDPERFGLWLDKRMPDCAKDPFADETKYPGVKYAHRGEEMPAGSFYGYPTGIVGLRLFPNPAFDAAAKAKWDPVRYYNDPAYPTKDLIRPYRVGMACAFCHVGPNPLKPPADPNNPKWENLSSNVGAQYFWFNRIFAYAADQTNLTDQVLNTYRPGALDTSLVSTDYLDNPRTMNAVYYLKPRVELASRWGHETLAGGGLNNKQFNDFFSSGPLTVFYEPPSNVWTPRVLKDGADSVGVLGALNRVYLNIGLYSEEWLRHFNALFGGEKTTPILIEEARKNSTYWNVTEQWTPAMADFFLNSTEPHHLADAPGGKAYQSTDDAQLTRGKEVFAERCARCHSSKAPQPAVGVDPGGCSGPDYLDCFNRYWAWTKTSDYKAQMRAIVMKPDFLDQNYLSSELRVPVTLTQTNACSPLASNAIGGSIWDNFSSQTYKSLPSVGEITYYHPITGEPRTFKMPAGGRGYTRPASLVSLWATSPFLLNNSVGEFNADPSVAGRMKSFDIAIEQMLWPEKRATDPIIGAKVKGPSLIDRISVDSYIKIPTGFLPGILPDFVRFENSFLPMSKDITGLQVGPIPKGTPIGLLASLDLDPGEHLTLSERLKRDKTVLELIALAKLERKNFEKITDLLISLSKCPDYIVNRGHYFGTDMLDPKEQEPGLSDPDKRALIAFLKTF
jgi:cytochrome c2